MTPFRFKKSVAAILGCIPLLTPIAARAQANSWQQTLGSPSIVWGVNATGDVAAGSGNTPLGQRAFVWTASGMRNLGVFDGGSVSGAYGVNAAGDVVVGGSDSANGWRAFRWTAASGMTNLGVLTGGASSSATGVNAAGDVVVGSSGTASGDHAFRWTQATGMRDLGVLAGGTKSEAYGVNAVGDVVVGISGVSGLTEHAFRWTQASGMTDLGTMSGGNYSFGHGVNAAGDVVVGWANTASGAVHAFRWTQASGTMSDLGVLAGGNVSQGYAVNAAGDVVVGRSDSSQGGRAMRWTAGTGMQSVEDWLASNGVKVSGVTTDAAYSVNAAGDVVAGQLQNGHAFIARTSAIGKGLIDVPDYNRTLQAVALPQAQLSKTTDLVLNGLMGSVPHTLLQPGKLRAWASGDWGQQNREGNDGQAAAGDFGLAVGITDKLEGQLALGQQYADSNTLYSGKTSAQQTYVAPGLTYLFPQANVAVGVLGYYADGNIDVSRGYLNAGTPTLSKGSAGTSTTGARLRADWINAYSLGPVGMTPYVSYTWINSKINAYTEAGGSFAAQWNARTDTAQLLRLGQDSEWAVNEQFKLTGRLEYVQRLQQDNPAATGRIVGLSGFAFDANQKQNDWVRVGLGGEYKLTATSLLRAMLNVTTEKADAPDVWLNVMYAWTF